MVELETKNTNEVNNVVWFGIEPTISCAPSFSVFPQDYIETERLLSLDNVDQEALLSYAREAADFGTNYHLPSLDYAINHYGQPDVAMFDFTCMYAAENAALIRERHGHQLLVALVGDSLLEVRVQQWAPDLDLDPGDLLCPLLTALLAHGYRLCSGFPGSLRRGVDGARLGTGTEPSGNPGRKVPDNKIQTSMSF